MKLEIYFDYLCEFCDAGRRSWERLLPLFPQIEPVWRPCEAHPRASEPRYGMHSDLAIQGMFFLQACGGDVSAYNHALFDAAWRHGENLEDIALLSKYGAAAGADKDAFQEALRKGAYADQLRQANAHAWNALALRAVPTYILDNERRLNSVLGIGVSEEKLKTFLQSACTT